MTTVALLLATSAIAFDDQPAELAPYDVTISIEFAATPEFPASFRDLVVDEVRKTIEGTIGERWSIAKIDLDVAADLARPFSSPDAASLPIERGESVEGDRPGIPAATAPDKVFYASVVPDGPHYVVSAREWDRLTDTWGPVRTSTAITRGEIARALVGAIRSAFRPVAEVRVVDESVSLAVKAAAIPTPDPAALPLKPGMLFRSLLRRFDRDGELIEIRPVPYTFFEITAIEGATASVEIHSALRSPVGSRRGLVDAWAIAAPAAEERTKLRLERRGDSVPLSGRRVEVRTTAFVPGQDEPPPSETLLTDRSGTVVLARQDDHTLLWLTIKSGDATLMRLPIAPGVDRNVVVPLGDDQGRRDAEGRLAILTGELIETVAKRATLLATARNRARSGRYEEADDALKKAAKLPGAAEFRRRVAAIETPAAIEAEKAGDRVVAARIRALGRKATDLVDRYLNPDALRAAREEVEELKRTDPDR